MSKRVIALGFFDGVHLGHGGLLKRTRQRANELGCSASVMTFDRHPGEVISGTRTQLITSRRDREFLMRSCYGMDEVVFIHFSRSMMEMPWMDFVKDCLLGDLNVCHVVCGQDFRFGHRGSGTAELLAAYCREHGIGCDVIEEILVDTIPVHSSLIRGLLQQGLMEEAARYLGHPHCLSGPVISGKRLGRTIGIPTANIAVPHGVLTLPNGVYATQVCFDDQSYMAVTNVGCCPTVSDGAPVVVEPWILDFSGDLYGKEIRIFFHKRLREERKFPSLEALQAEIHRNAQETRDYFAEAAI